MPPTFRLWVQSLKLKRKSLLCLQTLHRNSEARRLKSHPPSDFSFFHQKKLPSFEKERSSLMIFIYLCNTVPTVCFAVTVPSAVSWNSFTLSMLVMTTTIALSFPASANASKSQVAINVSLVMWSPS